VSGSKDELIRRLCAATGVAAVPAAPELAAAAAARAQHERDRRQWRTPLFGTIDVRNLPLSFRLCEHPAEVWRGGCVFFFFFFFCLLWILFSMLVGCCS
jgi:hypothetical protein